MNDTGSADRRSAATALSEAGLLVLALGTLLSMSRLLAEWSWVVPLGAAVTTAWLTNVVLRRVGCSMAVTALAQALIGLVVVARIAAAETMVALVVPTPASISAIAAEMDASFGLVSELVAPVPAADGFIAATAIGFWAIAAFADAAAIRYRAPVQAAVPYLAVFTAVGVLARDHGRVGSAAVFGVALAGYVAAQRVAGRSTERWFGARSTGGAGAARGTAATAVAAVAVLGTAIVAAVAAAPLVSIDEPVLDLREIGRGAGPRTVVSPFVGIRSLLTDRSDEVMFRVEAPQGAYWRLTALERFDADQDIWVSRAVRYSDVGEQLPAPGPQAPSQLLEQRFEIQGLSGLWLPAAFRPSRVDSPEPVGYDADSSSLILREGEPQPSLTYEVTSEVPQLDDLGDAPRSVGPGAHYLEVPDLSSVATDELEPFRDLATPAEQLLALQNWFRDFDYDENVDFSGSADPLGEFLQQRRGFCQQFSSAFALFARELGIPSRVAVGFTEGQQLQPGSFTVRGRNAHAWPEVYLADLGWVAYEPTPQRGNPQAEQYTGVPPAQAEAPTTTTTVSVPATSSPNTSTPATTAPPSSTPGAVEPPDTGADTAGSNRWLIPAAIVVFIAAAAAVAMLLRRRSALAGSTDSEGGRDQAVRQAWRRAVGLMAPLGIAAEADETPMEFASRCDGVVDTAAIHRLAELETQRRFAETAPSAADCDAASELVDELRQAITSNRGRSAGPVPSDR